ncbi:SCO family protein [Halobellus captivus]|uniref:SCO family protein n=1 Tax=Halobellus captivus TaxID=2592614 RepID=UPI0011A16625|nr:SCO family protein [Halobellus captivus]
MQRRTVLRAVSAAGVVGTAGCLGLGDSNPHVVLDEPDRDYASDELPYPAWGQRVPDVTLPDPISGDSFSTRSVEMPAVYTFFFSHCDTVCPVLIQSLRNVQTHAIEEEYADAVAFFPVTFDPERDDRERLETYAAEMNVALDAGNWHFLRPESVDRAKATVEEEFGVAFEKTRPEDMDTYMFVHAAMTYLVNADGYVERAYRTDTPDPERLIEDLRVVRNG